MTLAKHPQVLLLIERYHGLPPRDRSALQLLAVVVVGLLFYLLVWSPVNSFYASSVVQRERQLSLIQYLHATEAQARAVGTGKPGALAGQSLLSQISSSTQRFQIKPNRLQPEGSDAVSVWFDGVNFNNLVRWLEAQAQQGITVRQISIDRDELPGTVSARVILHN
jgi:general secretion pathway protein M